MPIAFAIGIVLGKRRIQRLRGSDILRAARHGPAPPPSLPKASVCLCENSRTRPALCRTRIRNCTQHSHINSPAPGCYTRLLFFSISFNMSHEPTVEKEPKIIQADEDEDEDIDQLILDLQSHHGLDDDESTRRTTVPPSRPSQTSCCRPASPLV